MARSLLIKFLVISLCVGTYYGGKFIYTRDLFLFWFLLALIVAFYTVGLIIRFLSGEYDKWLDDNVDPILEGIVKFFNRRNV